jgi:exodeoxyribonuclease-5
VRCGELELNLRLLPPVGSEARQQLDRVMQRLRTQARDAGKRNGRPLWRRFFLLRDAFASLGPAAVLTVHRSQGSSFGEVFVADDVFWPQDLALRRQLVYVAVSRARHGVWLVGRRSSDELQRRWQQALS